MFLVQPLCVDFMGKRKSRRNGEKLVLCALPLTHGPVLVGFRLCRTGGVIRPYNILHVLSFTVYAIFIATLGSLLGHKNHTLARGGEYVASGSTQDLPQHSKSGFMSVRQCDHQSPSA